VTLPLTVESPVIQENEIGNRVEKGLDLLTKDFASTASAAVAAALG
jgi:hypothetical protein